MPTAVSAVLASFALAAPCFGVAAAAAPAALQQGAPLVVAPPAAEPDAALDRLDTETVDAAPVTVPETPADPYAVTPEERETILIAAAAALSRVKTARGTFTQIAPDFSISTGNFVLRRPGRMRFSYDDPTPLLIVADGATVAIEDRDLETVDRVPLASTPLGLVLDDRIDFETDAEVTRVEKADGLVAVEMRDRSGEAEGDLTLILDSETFELLSWRAVDQAGGVTSVQLADVETNVRVDPRLFRLEDPEDRDDRRR